VVPVHVVQDAGAGVGQWIRARDTVVVGRHPVHRGKAPDEVQILHVEPPEAEVVEVDPVRGARVPGQVDLARVSDVGARQLAGFAEQREPGGGERIAGLLARSALDGLRDEQARARVGLEILGVKRHRADEDERLSQLVERVRHHRRERMARVLA
jgi:hypothetical protein